MALSYPARDLDPTEQFLPFEDPFVFLSAGKWQSIFSSFYALLAAPLVPHGIEWLVALAMLGAIAAVTSTSGLPGAHPVAGPIVLLATPVWLYGLTPNETALALGCAIAAMAVAARVAGPRGDWVAGLLLGTATLLRDESLLMAPGLVYARYLSGTPIRELPRTLAAVGFPILAMAVLDHWWFERPMLAHLRHAVPGFDALLPRSRARLPELDVMGWQERLTTLVEYWLLGFAGAAVAAALTVWIALAHGLKRLAPVLVATLVASSAVLHIVDLVLLGPAPRVVAGLLRLAPFLLLAVLPRANGEPAAPLTRLVWVTAGCYLAVVALTLNTEGGKATGPRLIIGLWPLLAAAAIDTLSSYIAACSRRMDRARHRHRRHDPGDRLAGDGDGCGAAGPAGPQHRGCRGRADRARDRRSGHRPGRDVRDRDRRRALLRAQAAAGPAGAVVGSVADARQAWGRIGSRTWRATPTATPHFPEYRRAEMWGSGRFIISRWVRETSASP